MSAAPQLPPAEIQARLRSLRLLRLGTHLPWLMIVVLGLVYAVLPEGGRQWLMPVYQLVFAWAIAGFFMSHLIRRYLCPRCGERFHYRGPGQRFLSLYPYNDFAVKCGRCGLRLDGTNVQ